MGIRKPNPKRQLGGLKAKQYGDSWESILKRAGARQRISVVHILNGCKRIGATRLIPAKQPFDFCAFYQGRGVAFDCKTVATGTFTHSLIDWDQIEKLRAVHVNAPAGYLVWFRKSNSIVFIPVSILMRVTPGSGLSPDQGLNLGTVEDFRLAPIFELRPAPDTVELVGE